MNDTINPSLVEMADGTFKYGNWIISRAYVGWQFVHKEFDGIEAPDNRYGHAESPQACAEEIDEIEGDAA